MSIIYRNAKKEDIPEINDLFIELVKTINQRMKERGEEPYLELESGFNSDFWDKFFENEDIKIIIAEDAGKVVGFLSLINHGDYIYLDDFSVNNDYRGQGIGTKLINMAEEYAREKGVDRLSSHVETTNYEAIDFYKNRGFNIQEQEGHRLFINKGINISLKDKLFERNKKIINELLSKIERTCPDSIDMVAIAGSFASDDYYEKSDLDVVIIGNNETAKKISSCFIMDDVGFDIYVHSWDDFEKMSKYETPYVTKLKQLDIVYTRSSNVSDRYKELQSKLNKNMNDEELINKNISKLFSNLLVNYSKVLNCDDISDAYKILGKFMFDFENILYLLNKGYIEHGVKGIPIEIIKMKNVPRDAVSNYLKLPDCTEIQEIIDKMYEIESSLESYLKNKDIKLEYKEEKEESIGKRDITKEDLIGSFEELYSNYYNKLKYAFKTDDKYLSFKVMLGAQDFYDEYSSKFNIEPIDLIGSYNPNDLESNFKSFVSSLLKWKVLYDTFYTKINIINDMKELYSNKKIFMAYQYDYEKEFIKKLNQESNNEIYTR